MKKLTICAAVLALIYSCNKEDIKPGNELTLMQQLSGTYSGTCQMTVDSTTIFQVNIPVTFLVDSLNATNIMLTETGYFGKINIEASNVRKEENLIKFDLIEQSNYLHGVFLMFNTQKCSGSYNTKSKTMELVTDRRASTWGVHYSVKEILTKTK